MNKQPKSWRETHDLPPFVAASTGAALMFGGRMAGEFVGDAGSPVFVYDMALVAERVATLKAALNGTVKIHYAIKANPHPDVVGAMVPLVDGFDIASGGELRIALAAGVEATTIGFAGPAKREDELRAAIEVGVLIHVEGEGELGLITSIARHTATRPRIALRVNPDFTVKSSAMKMGGGPRPFGIDAEAIPDVLKSWDRDALEFMGFQIFSGSQNLDPDGIVAAQAAILDLAARLATNAPGPVSYLNVGGGFGIPYAPGDVALDIDALGVRLADLYAARPEALKDAEIVLELGRYLIGPAGIYLTRVVERKVSRGQVILICDGGMHHHLAASGNFGQVIHRNFPIVPANKMDAKVTEIVDIAGCLCTPLDQIGRQIGFPTLKAWDLVAVLNSGAYTASASPSAFLGHGPAAEIVVNT